MEVPMGGIAVGQDGDLLFTKSLWTCLGLTLHDPRNKIGVLAHVAGYDIGAVMTILDRASDARTQGMHSDDLTARLVFPSMTLDEEALEYMAEVKEIAPQILQYYSEMMHIQTYHCRPEYGVGLLSLAPGTGKIVQRESTDQMFLDMWGT